MKCTYNWLKDFVAIKLSPAALADKLTMAGLEVTSLKEVSGDVVFEIEVTSNRPDWLSIIGIAREVAAITGASLKAPVLTEPPVSKGSGQREFGIQIADSRDCSLYTARIIEGLRVGPSPDWLKRRLELLGCRSVNNIVDITNYVLFEYGEPLHAFDCDTLAPAAIVVRRARDGEKLITLDGAERTLSADELVIADTQKAVAVAGIMGGKGTEVSERTTAILLEAALFNPLVIRRGRQRLGVQSDSSYRFERGVDGRTLEQAARRATALIRELSGGRLVARKYSTLPKLKKKSIRVAQRSAEEVIGEAIPPARIKGILKSLGFSVTAAKNGNFSVGVPEHRQDILSEIDVIEEIARILGYPAIPMSLPAVKPQPIINDDRDTVGFIKRLLAGLGLNEVITYSLVDAKILALWNGEAGQGAQQVEVMNPLSAEQGVLRTTLIPSLLGCVAYNLNRKRDYVHLFEIAKVFRLAGDKAEETLTLGVALCGVKPWFFEQGVVHDQAGVLHVKAVSEVLCERLGIEEYSLVPDRDAAFGVYAHKERIGTLCVPAKAILEKFEIKNKEVAVLEINLETLLSYAHQARRFRELPAYPAIARDISFVLDEKTVLQDVFAQMREAGLPFLQEITVADYYKGKQIPAGSRGLTLSCVYRSDQRTLTEAEISPLHARVVEALTQRFGAAIR